MSRDFRASPRGPDGETVVTVRPTLSAQQAQFERVDDGSEEMNIDASSTQVENIWNGPGAGVDAGADWTQGGSAGHTVGPAFGHVGDGLNTAVRALDDTTEFQRASAFDVTSGHDALEFWLDPKVVPPGSNLTVYWRDGVTQVGLKLSVENYAKKLKGNTPYRLLSIPVIDFNTGGTVVDTLVFQYEGAAGQRYCYDDIELVTGPKVFRLASRPNQIWHIKHIKLVLASDDNGWRVDKFGDITGGLSKGLMLQHRQISTGIVFWRVNAKDNVDLLGRYAKESDTTFSGTPDQRVLVLRYDIVPSEAVVNQDCVLDIKIRDDLSSVTVLEAFAHFEREDVSP